MLGKLASQAKQNRGKQKAKTDRDVANRKWRKGNPNPSEADKILSDIESKKKAKSKK